MKPLPKTLALCALLCGAGALSADESQTGNACRNPALPDATAAAAQPAAPKTQAPATTAPKKPYKGVTHPAACMARGAANMTTCWIEAPRCVVYDNSEVPGIGLVVGVPEGALYTTARALTGACDIVFLGFTAEGMHRAAFPDFIWQAEWLYTGPLDPPQAQTTP